MTDSLIYIYRSYCDDVVIVTMMDYKNISKQKNVVEVLRGHGATTHMTQRLSII